MMAAVTRSASASPSVFSHSSVDASWFPLKSISDVLNFFRRSLEQSSAQGIEPDLTLLSIIAGYIELSLTTGDAAQAAAASAAEHALNATPTNPLIGGIVGSGMSLGPNTDVIMGNSVPFPIVTHELISGLYKKFQSILSGVEKPKSMHNRQANRDVIKKVSDVIWNSLIRCTYKDRAHLQNLYSYLSGNKLDCFGVALGVVAGCQMLGYRDVRLAVSEDHAWIVFGNKRVETIEVTWHGKGSEDKRGQDITSGVESGSWLYLRGLAVVCDRPMEVAAIVSAINISLTANSDCVEVAEMQQKLLWLLYDMGHLKKYPMGLGTLGELEEINPTHKHINCEQLYREAIQSSREHYQNHHVYPHTYQGNYYNRLLKYREAFASWANAADVIRLYTYNCRDDEEVYKELLDIANEMIPYVMKTESSGHSARSILRDSEVFANLLRFYDGICQWEEDSLTPILHIGWAKPLVNNITKFDYEIRSQVVIKVPEDDNLAFMTPSMGKVMEAVEKNEINEAKKESNNVQVEGNNNNLVKKDERSTSEAKKKEMPTTLADLTAACGEKILNPDFLLQGGGQPFAEQRQQQQQNNNNNNNTNNNNINEEAKSTEKTIVQPENDTKSKLNSQHNNVPEPISPDGLAIASSNNGDKPSTSTTTTPSPPPAMPTPNEFLNASTSSASFAQRISASPSMSASSPTAAPSQPPMPIVQEEDSFEFVLKRPIITLYSQKMKGLKDLLLSEKLNTHAISLQVTAQSVASKKVRGIDKQGNHTTNSTYATANVSSNTGVAGGVGSSGGSVSTSAGQYGNSGDSSGTAVVSESLAASRPKRTRRE